MNQAQGSVNDIVIPVSVRPELPAESLDDMLFSIRMVGELLEEKSEELEPTWEQARQSAAELETLHRMEAMLVARAASVGAGCLSDVMTKLEIWRTLAGSCDDRDEVTLRDRLILSVRDDIERFVEAGTGFSARPAPERPGH